MRTLIIWTENRTLVYAMFQSLGIIFTLIRSDIEFDMIKISDVSYKRNLLVMRTLPIEIY